MIQEFYLGIKLCYSSDKFVTNHAQILNVDISDKMLHTQDL